MVFTLCVSAPIYDELCSRVWNFIVACNTSACSPVRDVVDHGIRFGRMKSIIGQNAWFLCQVLCIQRRLTAGVLYIF